MRFLPAAFCVVALGCGSSPSITRLSEPLVPPTSTPEASSPDDSTTAAPPVRSLTVEVVRELAHDPSAFTQGLVHAGDVLYESTGRDTTLRTVDPATGDVLTVVDVDDAFFGEGLALVGDRLVQLTFLSEVAFVYDADTLEQIDRFDYQGEGWGLCQLDDGRLAMTDGSSRVTFRDPDTFEPVGSIDVTLGGEPVVRLNELECVGATIWANVWKTNSIVAIDAADGRVEAVVDAQLLDDLDPADGNQQVLNGIAYDPGADTFLVTGKEWPTMFEVRFVEAG